MVPFFFIQLPWVLWHIVISDLICKYNNCGGTCLKNFGQLKGIVHLNIIFSYMKVNKKCNLDHLVY